MARAGGVGSECAVKHCERDAELGMTIVLAGLRIEVEFCEEHFDVLDKEDDWGPIIQDPTHE